MRQDVADGIRKIIKYRGVDMYLMIFPEVKEIFISDVADREAHTSAGIDIITRFASIVWQEVGFWEMIEQLGKSKRSSNDLPGILYEALKVHHEDFSN